MPVHLDGCINPKAGRRRYVCAAGAGGTAVTDTVMRARSTAQVRRTMSSPDNHVPQFARTVTTYSLHPPGPEFSRKEVR
jgi:hypothetical protein